MEFDKSKVYTALNADELKVGSKVIVADSMTILKDHVNYHDRICVLDNIENEDYTNRFFVNDVRWNLAYLVSEPEEKKLKWTDLKIGDIIQYGDTVAMVTVIDSNPFTSTHIYAYDWISDEELEEYETVE